ncbi:MAG: endonuclease MutS2 [Acidiferrobacterales bacterium]
MRSDLKALEFDAVRRLLEKLATTPYGADAARNIEPAPDIGVARGMLAAVTAARSALDAGDAPSLKGTPDVRAALRQAAQPGAALSGIALHNLRQVILEIGGLKAAVSTRPDLYPGPKEHLSPPTEIEIQIDRTINPSGRVRDNASPRLAALAKQIGELRQEVIDALRVRLKQPDLRTNVSAEMIVWQGARAFVSLPADCAELVAGVHRGKAAGGRNHLVEPMEVVSRNNRLETLNGQQEVESQVVLRETTSLLRTHLESLGRMIDALTWIDLALAGGHLSRHLNAHAPRLTDKACLLLDRAFHPALLLRFADGQGPEPVPLSLALDSAQPMLVITGPNTGGKTVVLKTVGLLITMAHCGLHIPAEGNCLIGDFSRVIVDIGDPQSLYHHLSTFAGHVEKLKRLLSEADAGTLVLLDELGTGTDPEEGAALAMAVLEELARRGVYGIVTTHLSPLKEFASQHEHLTNASMLFDEEKLVPSYRLSIGTIGRSLGLVIAEKNGLSVEVVDRARQHLRRIAPRHE